MYYFGTLKIFSSSVVGLSHINLDEGGKVILPPSILAEMSDSANSDSPMMFSLSHPVTEIMTHCGVLEFSAEEGSLVAPGWVLDQIGVTSGDTVYIESVYLPVGNYARFKPMSTDFLDITNQKAVLENRLRGFACLTKGDIVPINYNNKHYMLKIVATEPGDAICIVNCDLNVEFEEPLGYISPKPKESIENITQPTKNLTIAPETASFTGQGYRLDGKKAPDIERQVIEGSSSARGIPDYDWRLGTLTFFRNIQPSSIPAKQESDFSPFSGSGRSLK